MLGCPAYLVRAQFLSDLGVDAYDIVEPDTCRPLGFASEPIPAAPKRLFRTLFGRNLLWTSLRVYECTARSVVFSIREAPSIWRPRLLVMDADGRKLCTLHGIFAAVGGGFVLRDPSGRRCGRLYSDSYEQHYVFEGAANRPLGAIQEQPPSCPAFAGECARCYTVQLNELNGNSQAASVLLLAAALALDIVYRDRVGPHEISNSRSAHSQNPD